MPMIIRLTKIIFLNVAIFTILYTAIAAIFYFSSNPSQGAPQIENASHDSNTVRATYPSYSGMEADIALAIFEEWAAPAARYMPFVGYRREGFEGKAVNIEPTHGFRLSLNHSLDGSIWFLGGSTMWGTGATDSTTIPSQVANESGRKVLNLGESGFSSFQELTQLQLLLSQGYRPAAVVFYDGVNDGYTHCQRDEPVPSHAYRSRYANMFETFSELQERASGAEAQLVKNTPTLRFIALKLEGAMPDLWRFVLAPVRYAFSRNVATPVTDPTDNGTPFSEFRPGRKYLHCDDPEVARRAAKLMVFSWLTAHSVLNDLRIPIYFFLQPTASLEPERYNLDYLIDLEKQKIVDEEASYEGFYRAAREIWIEECDSLEVCDSFHDISSLLFDSEEPLFIDSSHIGPDGNAHVARAIVQILDPL